MLSAGLRFDIYGDYSTIGLAWGESKKARGLGFARKDVIKALGWAETHKKESAKIFEIV